MEILSNWSKQKQQIHSVTVGGAYESQNTAVKKKKTKLSVETFFTYMLQVIFTNNHKETRSKTSN